MVNNQLVRDKNRIWSLMKKNMFTTSKKFNKSSKLLLASSLCLKSFVFSVFTEYRSLIIYMGLQFTFPFINNYFLEGYTV